MPKHLLEKDIEDAVCRYATKRGVLARKFTSPSHRSVPDRLFIFPNGYVVFVEFKRPSGALTDGQTREIKRLTDRKQWVYVINNIEIGKLLVDSFTSDTAPEGFTRLPT